MRFVIIVCLWGFLLFPAWAQERMQADSLLKLLETATGADRSVVLRELSRAYLGADKEKSVQYALESVSEAEKTQNDSLLVVNLNIAAAAYQNTGDYRSSLPHLDRAVELARKHDRKAQLCESLEFKSTAYAGMKQTAKALPFAQEAMKLLAVLRDSVGLSNTMEIVAAAYKDLHRYDEAVRIFEEEMAMLDRMPKRIFEKGRVCVNLGEVKVLMNRQEEAIALFKKGRDYFNRLGYPVGALIATLDLANCLRESNRLTEASKTYHEIIDLNQSIQEPEVNALSHIGLGLIDVAGKRYDDALIQYKQAESSALPARLYSVLKELYGNMNDLYCLKGDYEGAKVFRKLSANYADTLLNADVLDRISEYQVQYETVQKEKDIAEKQLKITAQANEIFRKNTLNYGLLASLAALLVLGYLFYNRFRLRQKAELDAAVIREQQLGLNAVIEAQEAERKRIARDLHDGVAQELVGLKLGFDALSRRVGKIVPEEQAQFHELNTQLDATCTGVRGIAHVMSPPVLEQHGLAPSLEQLLRFTQQNTGLQARLETRDLPERLDNRIELGLYRIAQELLNNIVKHAQAARIVIELFKTENGLALRVTDDGKGFDFEAARQQGTMGVLNILSRVSTLNGQFSSEPNQPHGTVSLIVVPVPGI